MRSKILHRVYSQLMSCQWSMQQYAVHVQPKIKTHCICQSSRTFCWLLTFGVRICTCSLLRLERHDRRKHLKLKWRKYTHEHIPLYTHARIPTVRGQRVWKSAAGAHLELVLSIHAVTSLLLFCLLQTDIPMLLVMLHDDRDAHLEANVAVARALDKKCVPVCVWMRAIIVPSYLSNPNTIVAMK